MALEWVVLVYMDPNGNQDLKLGRKEYGHGCIYLFRIKVWQELLCVCVQEGHDRFGWQYSYNSFQL